MEKPKLWNLTDLEFEFCSEFDGQPLEGFEERLIGFDNSANEWRGEDIYVGRVLGKKTLVMRLQGNRIMVMN